MAGNLRDIIPSFFIGKNGEKLTPEQIKRRQGLANNAMLVATDTSPNAGGIASILAKGVAGLRAGYEDGRANDAIAANSASSQANIAKLLGGLGVTGGLSQGATVAAPTTAPVQGISGGSQTGAPVVAEGEIADYIRQAATARGIDPDTALRVAMSEGGLKDPVRQSDYVKNGVREASYGPFQLYMGGGLGNKALEAGIDPRDPSQWRQGVDFALDQAATGGWSPWYGAAKVGLGNRAGLENARAIGFNRQPSADSPTAAIETVSPSSGYVDPMVSARPNAAAALPPQTTSPVQPSQSSINPAVVEALSSPYASSEEKQIASLLLERQMGEQQQQRKLALAQQQREQEIARRQAIAQQNGINPAFASDDELWKGAAGQLFAAPSTTTLGNAIIDNRTGKPIYQGEPERQPLMNLGDGTLYDPNAPQDQRFIQAPNSNRNFRQATPDEIKVYGTNGQIGPDGRFYPVTPPQGTALSVDPNTGAVTFNQGPGIKPLTENQSKDSFFTTRMTSALPTLEANESALLNLGEKAAGAAPLGMGNYVQTEKYQLARDAGRDFVTAYLRKDSGAALTPAEERLYGELLLPQPGDKPATIELKRQRRQVAVRAIESGMPPQAVDGVLKAIKSVPGSDQPTLPGGASPAQTSADGWRDAGGGIKIRPKGGN